MSGIAGIWGNADEDIVRKMMRLISHRGPDAEEIFVDTKAKMVLGRQLLSLGKPMSGNQPIYNENRTKVIVADGEFYNFPQLRKKLSAKHTFQASCDSEVALHLYEELDNATAGKLDGMFAIAIADGKDIYLARDQIGIKPLYYSQNEKALFFASEIKALTETGRNIEEFPPGTWFHSKVGFRPYYMVPDKVPREMPFEIRLKIIREILDHAVVNRLPRDVRVGVFLSGGLNSSIIAAIARRNLGKLYTFSAGVKGSNDLEAARVVAGHLDTVHHEYQFSADEVIEKLPEIIYYLESFDQDMVRSAIPYYFVSLLASKEVKVILTGEGADELFAGYSYYNNFKDPMKHHQGLSRSVCTLRNTHLQKVDRMTMAHSIEARVPFLDLDMIEIAQTIPPQMKQLPVEKWILRKACEDTLPKKIVWREKEQFNRESGALNILAETQERFITHSEAEQYFKRHPKAKLRSAEECVYHHLLVNAYSNPEPILDNVLR